MFRMRLQLLIISLVVFHNIFLYRIFFQLNRLYIKQQDPSFIIRRIFEAIDLYVDGEELLISFEVLRYRRPSMEISSWK